MLVDSFLLLLLFVQKDPKKKDPKKKDPEEDLKVENLQDYHQHIQHVRIDANKSQQSRSTQMRHMDVVLEETLKEKEQKKTLTGQQFFVKSQHFYQQVIH